jgi:predicted metal-binding membrane protein
MTSDRVLQRVFVGVPALLLAAGAALTIAWYASMSAMGGRPMPDATRTGPVRTAGPAGAHEISGAGWVSALPLPRRDSLHAGHPSEGGIRMPGQTWSGAAASFVGMWIVMTVAMMLPSLVPMLRRYRDCVRGAGGTRLGRLTALVGIGYFAVWTAFGMAAFALGAALASIGMQQPALARVVPIAGGVIVLGAGALQFTAWKARHLACCREAPGRDCAAPADARAAWRHGVRLGLHCSCCCAGLMAILFVTGAMDVRAMAVVTGAITLERLAPAGVRVARAIGAVVVAAGVLLIARAAGLG